MPGGRLWPGAGLSASWAVPRHLDQRKVLGLAAEAFFAHPAVGPLPPTGPCLVAACVRQRRHADGCYCAAHQNPPAAGPSDQPQP